MSLDSLCRWQVQVSVYCARRNPAHLRCPRCSILFHLIDICFLTCICLWQTSQIQTCLRVVVGSGLVLTSPAFYEEHCQPSSGFAWPACPTNGNQAPISGGGRERHNLHWVCQTAVTFGATLSQSTRLSTIRK